MPQGDISQFQPYSVRNPRSQTIHILRCVLFDKYSNKNVMRNNLKWSADPRPALWIIAEVGPEMPLFLTQTWPKYLPK